MDGKRVAVRNVRGRYPESVGRLDSNNIEAAVQEEASLVRIRLDDAEHPEAWLELTIEIDA